MKVLQVLLPQGMGGVEKIASELVMNSLDDDINVFIAIDERYYEDFLQYFPVPVEKVVCLRCISIYRTITDIYRVIKEIKPDVIHTHARKECVLTALINRTIPHIRTQHMAEKPRIKVCFLEKILLKHRVDCWVATSRLLSEEYLLKKDYINANKVKVVYNGVSNTAFRTEFIRRNHFCIISRLTIQKGIDILLTQIERMPQFVKDGIKVDIWGEGPELQHINEQIRNLQLGKIVFYKGICKKPIEHFQNYDALLMPSRHEGLPLTMLEAMSTGTPVATHAVGCVKEFICNGENGWIIDEEFTWQDFFEQLCGERYRYKDICTNARITYEELFAVEKMCNSYYSLYKKFSNVFGE